MPDLPAAIAGIVETAMEREPDNRYQSVADMTADMEAYLADESKELTASISFVQADKSKSSANIGNNRYTFEKRRRKKKTGRRTSTRMPAASVARGKKPGTSEDAGPRARHRRELSAAKTDWKIYAGVGAATALLLLVYGVVSILFPGKPPAPPPTPPNLYSRPVKQVGEKDKGRDTFTPPKGCVLALSFDPDTIYMKNGRQYVRDLSGYGNDGEIFGAKPVKGQAGGALEFDGNDDRVNLKIGPALDQLGPISIIAVVKPYAVNKDQVILICENQYILWFYRKRVRFADTWGNYGDTSNNSIVAEQWACLAGVFSNVLGSKMTNSNTKVYINSQTSATAISGTWSAGFCSNVLIGNANSNYSTAFKGLIDEIAVFKRALSPAEIKLLYGLHKDGKSFCRAIGIYTHKHPPKAIKPRPSPEWCGKTPSTKQELHTALKKMNPAYDGNGNFMVDNNGRIVSAEFKRSNIRDISPLKGMALENLNLYIIQVRDLSPLKGMPLKSLSLTWCRAITDLSPLKGMLLTNLNIDRTKVTDLSPLKGMPLTNLHCLKTNLADLSPLKGMSLKKFYITGGTFTDLSPLKGMPLTLLQIGWAPITDLTPLQGMSIKYLTLGSCHELTDLSVIAGMPLEYLRIPNTSISDLGPVKGIKTLRELWASGSKISDLSPLKNLQNLAALMIEDTQVTDLSPLAATKISCLTFSPKMITKGIKAIRNLKSLKKIGAHHRYNWDKIPSAAEFWKRYDAGEFNKPAATKPKPTGYTGPVPKTPEQLHAALKAVNPKYNGRGKFHLKAGKIYSVNLNKCNISDLSPLRGMKLKNLFFRYNQVKDLSPLKGMPLRGLWLYHNQVADLSPLARMRLTTLDIWHNAITDLSPLANMTTLENLSCPQNRISDLSPLKNLQLKSLECQVNKITNLMPLKGMPLTYLECNTNRISDLSPLKGMKLTFLNCKANPITDISPLKNMPLKELRIYDSNITDLTLLQGMNLETFYFTPKTITKGLDIIRNMKSLKTIGTTFGKHWPTQEFWKRYDAGEFK